MIKPYHFLISTLFVSASSFAQNSFPNTGNVGIGTNSPSTLLHVNGMFLTSGGAANLDQADPTRSTLGFLANSGAMLMGWNRNAGAGETDFIANKGPGGAGGFAFYDHDNYNNETQLMWIRGDGNVSIGTPDPHGYKLAVNGTIRSKEVKVEAGPWPDYVFLPTYKLRPIKEVEAYLSKNGHLPEMPSAKEVSKEGVGLGELNSKLLKKLEELTLYIIQQNHRIEKMQHMLSKKK